MLAHDHWKGLGLGIEGAYHDLPPTFSLCLAVNGLNPSLYCESKLI